LLPGHFLVVPTDHKLAEVIISSHAQDISDRR
jgi:hypothetical protein